MHDIIKRNAQTALCVHTLLGKISASVSRVWTSHCIHSLCTEINFARTTKQLIRVIDGHVTTYCHFIGGQADGTLLDPSLFLNRRGWRARLDLVLPAIYIHRTIYSMVG